MTDTQPSPEAPSAPEPKRTKRLLIASPAKGGVPLHYVLMQEHILREPLPGWDTEFLVEAANSALTISRNVLAQQAIVRDFDRVLMLDLDHPTRREHLTRILSHDHDKYQLVSGLYCIKRPGRPFWLGIALKGAQPNGDGLLPASFLPTGFLSVNVAALRKMQQVHKDREVYIQDDVLIPPGPRRTKETMFDLFPVGSYGPRMSACRLRRVREAMANVIKRGVNTATRPQLIEALQGVEKAITDEGEPGHLLGEDYAFALLARQAGLELWLDVNCMVPHQGAIAFPITDAAVVATQCDRVPEPDFDLVSW